MQKIPGFGPAPRSAENGSSYIEGLADPQGSWADEGLRLSHGADKLARNKSLMKTDILEKAFRNHGGPWNAAESAEIANIEKAMEARIRRTQCANYQQVQSPIRFGFVNNGSFNAFATLCENTDIIGMNLGLLINLNNLFLAMMSHPEILPKVGNPGVEQPKLYDPTKAARGIYAAAAETPLLSPNDPVRKDYAQKLSWIGRSFILEHEFCHLFNGHVDWLQNHTKSALFDEIGASLIPGLSSLDRQTFEMDADCYGATHTTLAIFRNGGPSKVLENPHMSSPEDALYAVHFALYSVFRIFHNKPINEISKLLGDRNHPPAILRHFITAAAISSRVDDNETMKSQFTLEQCSEIGGRAVRGVEAAFLFLQGRKWDPKIAFNAERFPDGLQKACSTAANELRANWKKLREQLQRFMRGEKLAE
ncbi:hypothetical protein NK6_5659 [Bradyrhizobium diazoefficiens]|uniref:Uncharacterized protein n=1 Tax=Bradyrhizobium diazoefficiens TaxID=1355477 RepID=A0A0E4BS49_9BRAD|nr:hypothetical protein NK6_5659 [Bradyrhizobium diazoefficiens]